MNVLVQIAIDFLKSNLLPKLNINQVFKSLVDKVIIIIQELILVFTDSDKDNAAQLRSVWQRHYVELLAIVLSGASMAIKDINVKSKIIAVLKATLDKLESDEV